MDGSKKVMRPATVAGALSRCTSWLFVSVLLLSMAVGASAQGDDFGIWTSLGVEKGINKKWSLGAETEYRMRNDTRTADRWSLGVDATYKVAKWLKASAGYTLLYDNNKEDISYNEDGSYNNWRPSYWGLRHRFSVSATGSVGLGRFKLSLRERWQYTYRQEKTVRRYDFDNEWWEDKVRMSKSKHLLRSRFKADYDVPKCKVDPYVEVELFTGSSLEKVRYTAGADWKIRKKHVVNFFYRYQTIHGDDDDMEVNRHILGVGYTFKF